MRINSHEHEPTRSSGSDKVDDIELRNQHKTLGAADGRRQFSDALNDEGQSSGGEAVGDGAFQFYKVYKRRWFGLVQLTLLNIVVSWDVSNNLNRFFDHTLSFSFYSYAARSSQSSF